jgi:hypothetical protein
MIEHLEVHEEPDLNSSSEIKDLDALGRFVASEFAAGKTHVYVKGLDLGLLRKEVNGEVWENDGYTQYQNILRVCQNLAVLDAYNTGMDPLRNLEYVFPLDAAKSNKKSSLSNPDDKRNWTELHTEEASQIDPARIVSYWNSEFTDKDSDGEQFHILSVDHLKHWARTLENRIILQEMKDHQVFRKEGLVFAPIYSPPRRNYSGELEALDTLRYDRLKIDHAPRGKELPTKISSPLSKKVVSLLMDAPWDNLVGEYVRLKPGDALFIDNHRAAHAINLRERDDDTRLLHKFLLPELRVDDQRKVVATAIDKQREDLFTFAKNSKNEERAEGLE